MVVSCPHCRQKLAVKDELAGRRARCPKCQQPFTIPGQNLGRPLPSDAAPQLASSGSTSGLGDRSAGSVPGPLGNSPASAPTLASAVDERRPKCYFVFAGGTRLDGQPPNKVKTTVVQRIRDYLDEEGLDYEYVTNDSPGGSSFNPYEPDRRDGPNPADHLRPIDMAIHCRITEFDYGSRAMRYWLTFVAMFGPGSCKLAVELALKDGRGGSRSFFAKARQFVGLFGGDGEAMMKLNAKSVSERLATEVTRHVAGRWLINHLVYQWAMASMILGLISLACCFPLTPFGIGFGAASLAAISRRGLPKRKWMAITGIALSVVGGVLAIGLAVSLSRK